ncbi:bifunctional ADP-dependent NAD(P)H-hydrate dehydratase/NAD(P)H-hydrate epimerase [Marinagarivorans algicola]|uniref:bifunctional ADP-dependent NAD(P)H-hydrate dehydratase/NAD(P)H-hydrate epimerase n=1 Tax=Marinagarivorans algicola TaxID=1513270 RepID=UPI0006B66AB0|nr:bifunctional ADP-dependent NAD(P)H-hydrate dehydratase/NAD(P)H-hydrate epimerase [Marinagarivorans algicola]
MSDSKAKSPQPQSPVLPRYLYRAEQVRELDRLFIEEHKVAGIVLMKRAGRAAFELLNTLFPHGSITILCGAGNNAGDGFVVGALAAMARRDVQILTVSPAKLLTGDARRAYLYAKQEGVNILPYETGAASHLPDGCVIVDALVGTGLSGELRANMQDVINEVNATGLPVLALDVPSGLCANTGRTLGEAIKAYATITFIGCKMGLLTGRAPALVGQLYFDGLGAPRALYRALMPAAWNIDFNALKRHLPLKEADAHKGQSGHVLVVGGDLGMGGAAIMTAESAASAGSGCVSLATQLDHVTAALVRKPEVMAHGVDAASQLEPLLKRPSVIAVGPGMGQSSWSEQLMQQVLKTDKPLVVDADGLNLLADKLAAYAKRGHWVLTPHPGEAARLLHTNTAVVQQNRFEAVSELQRLYGGVVVLKGAGTLICDGERTVVAKVGNPGLATPGSGDVLTGIIASLIGQGLGLFEAAQLGVYVHGQAGDRLADTQGQFGMAASELAPVVRKLLN